MKTLEKKLLEMQIEVLIARRKTENFMDEVVLNNVSHALGEGKKGNK